MNILEVADICKAFRDKQVLKGVSFDVPANSVVGFIGKNGAGKTTTIKCITGLLKYDSGHVTVCDNEITYGRKIENGLIGYLQDVPNFYDYMTAREYLRLCAELIDIDKKSIDSLIEENLRFVGLAESKGKIGGFSRGMKQRLGIAQAIINKPKLLICDEPTSALDPEGRKDLLDILYNISHSSELTSVLFSTHILSDVERICDKVVILNNGEVCFDGSISEITNRFTVNRCTIEIEDQTALKEISDMISSMENVKVTVNGSTLSIVASDIKKLQKDVFLYAAVHSYLMDRFEVAAPNLEDFFLEKIYQ